MVQIYNTDLINEVREVAKIQQLTDTIPKILGQTIVPVIDVNPKHARIINIVQKQAIINSTSGTIYYTPLDKDFYLCGAQLSMIKDSTATSLYSIIQATPFGKTSSVEILMIAGLSLTAQNDSISISFEKPIRLARGTNINLAKSTNVGNVTASGIIYGYLIDNISA